MYARITTLHSDASGNLDHKREVAPQLWAGAKGQPGCLGGAVLADPVGGTVHAITFWANADEVLAAKESGRVITQTAAAMLGAEPDEAVVQLLEVISLDFDDVMAAANRRGERWPVIRGNGPPIADML